jgi:hypothetical protein
MKKLDINNYSLSRIPRPTSDDDDNDDGNSSEINKKKKNTMKTRDIIELIDEKDI